MEEKKNKKGFIWLIVILIILVLGLVGYIVYNKILKVDNIYNNNITTIPISTTEKKEISKDKVSEIFLNYPNENDATVIVKGTFEEIIDKKINHEEIYKDQKSKFIGTDIELIYNSKKCDVEEEQDENGNVINSYNWCEDIEFSIGSNQIFNVTENSKGSSYPSPYILINYKYIIVQFDRYLGDGKGYIRIYDLSGNLIKEINNTGYIGGLPVPDNVDVYDDYNFDDKYVKLDDKKIYFVSYTDVCYPIDNRKNASIKYLDLNTMQEKVLKEFKAYFSQQC